MLPLVYAGFSKNDRMERAKEMLASVDWMIVWNTGQMNYPVVSGNELHWQEP